MANIKKQLDVVFKRYGASLVAGMSNPALISAFGWKDRTTAESYVNSASATKEHKAILTSVLN